MLAGRLELWAFLVVGFALDGIRNGIDVLAFIATKFKIWTGAMRLFPVKVYLILAVACL